MMWAGRMGLSNPNHVLPPSFFGSEVVAHAINIHYQTSTEIWSIMLSQEAVAFESLSQRIVTNLSACGNKRKGERGSIPEGRAPQKHISVDIPGCEGFHSPVSSMFHLSTGCTHDWRQTSVEYLPPICHSFAININIYGR